MGIILEKRKYVEIRYNTDNAQILCITIFLIVLLPNLKRTYDQIDQIKK